MISAQTKQKGLTKVKRKYGIKLWNLDTVWAKKAEDTQDDGGNE
jgi:hypothetical protein